MFLSSPGSTRGTRDTRELREREKSHSDNSSPNLTREEMLRRTLGDDLNLLSGAGGSGPASNNYKVKRNLKHKGKESLGRSVSHSSLMKNSNKTTENKSGKVQMNLKSNVYVLSSSSVQKRSPLRKQKSTGKLLSKKNLNNSRA